MALPAGGPGRYTAMQLPCCLRTPYHKGNEHSVLLKEAHGMADLALEIPVSAHLPALECILHEMALDAILGILFGMTIIPVSHDPAYHGNEQQQYDNRFSVLFYELDKKGRFISHSFLSFLTQKSKEFVKKKRKDETHKGAKGGKKGEHKKEHKGHNKTRRGNTEGKKSIQVFCYCVPPRSLHRIGIQRVHEQ
jgi:hypothetical protein